MGFDIYVFVVNVLADHEAAEQFIKYFNALISEKKLTAEQIYNADETALFWTYVPRKTLATAYEETSTEVKDSKERLTVLACANAAGTYKYKLLVIGKNTACFQRDLNFPRSLHIQQKSMDNKRDNHRIV